MHGARTLLFLPLLASSSAVSCWLIPRNQTNSTSPTAASQSHWLLPTAVASGVASAFQSFQAEVSSIEHNNTISANLQALNPNHATCDVASQTDAQSWSSSAGDQVFSAAMSMYSNNVLICTECFGLTKDKCTSSSSACQNGLKDLAGDSHLDSAMARLANDTTALSLDCQVGSGSCDSAPACADVQTPGMWAIRTSLTTLHNTLTTVYTAMGNAQTNATNSMDAFEDFFAPVPTDSSDLFGKIMESIVTCMFGLAGPLLEGAEEAVKTGVEVASTINEFGQGIAEDLESDGPTASSPKEYLPALAGRVKDAVAGASQSLFHTGQSSTKGGASLAKAMEGGKLMSSDSSAGTSLDELSKTFVKLLFQQTAVLTWDNLQKDGDKHYPFIAFDNQPCDQVDSKNSMFGGKDLDVALTYNGACYYLLDATALVSPGVFTGSGTTMPTIDCNTSALPGGTVKGLDGQSLFGGLALADFIIPSVESWAQNGKANGAPAASYAAGKIPTNIQQAGAVTLPVCDYTGQKGTAGKDCPDFAAKIDKVTDGCPISS